MPVSCCSNHRCQRTSCPSCTWRYALHVTRRIIACDPHHLHVVRLRRGTGGPYAISALRKAAHNAVAYQRRRYRHWREFGVWGWYVGGDFHGVVELGSISTTEFLHTFQRRGGVLLRPIDTEDLRNEVYSLARLVSAETGQNEAGRYQPFKIAIEPVNARRRAKQVADYVMIEPMPYLV
jgi:hypothetical protein